MPRKSKGPHLKLKRYSDREAKWVIRDGQRTLGTGCDECDGEKAQRKLAKYILEKHDPAKAISQGDPNQAKIADVLALEMERLAKTAMPLHRQKELITLCQNMGNWFGNRVVGDLNGKLQERYAAERTRHVIKMVQGKRTMIDTGEPAQIAAWRDLKILAAAINRFLKTELGGVQARFSPVLPDAPEPRERWLTRTEAARLIMTAWRRRREGTGERQWQHISRFTLVALYSGSRAGDICGASLVPSVHKGYIDLDRGIFKRKPDAKKATSKRQPTITIPPRLLAHLRRWHRIGISKQAVIEYRGQPVTKIREGWENVVEAAGLGTDDPKQKVLKHCLRHTAITWLLQSGVNIETVSLYCGVSPQTIRRVYRHAMPGQFDEIHEATHRFGR